jgi:hypothetical protein
MQWTGRFRALGWEKSMTRFGSLAVIAVLAAGCSSSPGRSSPPEPFQPGEYLLEASVSYGSGSETKVDRHEAQLLVEADQTISMTSTTGLCQGPPLPEVGQDRALGLRTFVCGEARYELRPSAGTVRGDLITTVMEITRVTECVEYRTTAEGQRVCVRTVERTVERPIMKRARLNVIETP